VLPAAGRVDAFPMVHRDEPRDETYLSLLGKLLAAIVATLWGTSLILAATIGVRPGTNIGLLVLGAGIALVLLSIDQIWRVMRKLG
jgi:hypothetical protein